MRKPILIIFACSLVYAGLAACDQVRSPVAMQAIDAPPEKLSDWNVVFADGDSFELNDQVVAYDLNTPLFSDYALKLRSVWVPEGATVEYRAQGPMDFPIGTIFSKTFHYEKAADFNAAEFKVVKADRESELDVAGFLSLKKHVLIETRLLIHYAEGWKALPYVWNDAQDEAFLSIAGDIRRVEILDGEDAGIFTYFVPDANQCGGCHTTNHSSKALQPIGPTAWQLDRDYRYGGLTANQLQHWHDIGFLDEVGDAHPHGASWARPEGASLQDRSKAYLDVNCAHCHNRDGAADTSGLDLALSTPVGRRYGVCKPPVAVGRGSGDRPYDIYPGRTEDSIMIYRMQHSDPAIAMPELGRSIVHVEAIELLSEWVASMQGEC